MAANGFGPVLHALGVMQSNAKKDQKEQAHEYLNQFQKSKEAWASTHSILGDSQTSPESRLFAATTLKGKITYDLDQLPRSQLPGLRDSILSLLVVYADGPKPIRTALCVCLAILAIQMTEWKDVLQFVGSALGSNAGDCVLEFLQVLPEELYEGRKINLSEEDLDARSKELVEDNVANMLQLLINYSASSATAASNPLLLDCITSWLREIPITLIVNSPLLDTIFNGVAVEATFEPAVECLSSIFRDTREVDDSIDLIKVLYPRLLALQPRVQGAAEADDGESLKGIARIFAEAGEAWVALIARAPKDFRGLVEAILECCVRDKGTDAVRVTFNFWYDFKQMITIERWAPALHEYVDVWSSLTDTMIKHLEYPRPEDSGDADLFDGDRDAEEKFREFRHEMGDVLKDCCHVITTTECLAKSYRLIQDWISKYAAHVSGTTVPNWQALEAPLFAFRAMGREVSPDEETVLPQMMPLLVQIPKHAKLLYQAVMAVGRYTEWIAKHPDYLQPQFKFILESMEFPDLDVVRAAALSFRHLGQDCRHLLKDELVPVQSFYVRTLDKLPAGGSQDELTEGVAKIASAQPPDKIFDAMKLLCDPVIERIKKRASALKDDTSIRANADSLADAIGFVTIFVNSIQPHCKPPESNQAVAYCQEIFPVLAAVCENFTTVEPILESVCRCWRSMVIAYRTDIFPLLESLATQLAAGFENTRQGCFLWATDAVLREFAVGADYVDASTTTAIYNFFEQQAFAFLKVMNDLPPSELGDVIEDFFRMLQDALIYYHSQLLPAAICGPILTAAISALALEAQDPLLQTLHWLRDLFTYGTDQPASSSFAPNATTTPATMAANKAAVMALARNQGQQLVRALLTGMMFTFPSDCLHDASGVVLGLYRVAPQETAQWIGQTIDLLPQGSVRAGEKEKLLVAVSKIQASGDETADRKVRTLVADFTTGYRRRNVMPREGLGPLEPARFRYKG